MMIMIMMAIIIKVKRVRLQHSKSEINYIEKFVELHRCYGFGVVIMADY